MNWGELNETNTCTVNFPLNLIETFCTCTFGFKVLSAFLNVHTRGKINTSPFYIPCMLMPQVIPLPTLILVCTWHGESHPLNKNVAKIRCTQYNGGCWNIILCWLVVFLCGHKGRLPQAFKSVENCDVSITNNELVTYSW